MEQSKNNLPKVSLYCRSFIDKVTAKAAYTIIMKYNDIEKSFSESFRKSTNNRLELMGIISGFQKLKKTVDITVYISYHYIIDPFEKDWISNWVENNWISNKRRIANQDLWKQLLDLTKEHIVKFEYCNNEYIKKCYTLSQLETQKNIEFKIDEVFEEECSQEIREDRKIRIDKEGDLCRKCSTPVVKKTPTQKKIKENQIYYYEYILQCPNCRTIFFVESAKRYLQ